jgi:TRAP transporter TAXI family solute receptor
MWPVRRIRVPVRGAVLLSASIALAMLAYWVFGVNYRGLLPHETLRASGIPRGTYERVVEHMEGGLNSHSDELGFRLELRNIASEGSIQTVEQIDQGAVDVGIVQANVNARLVTARAVAALYDEVYLLFVNFSQFGNLYEVASSGRTLKVGCLGKGSQSYEDLHAIIEYYGFDSSLVTIVAGGYEETAQRLTAGHIDAALFVTGLQSETVRRLAKSKNIRLLGFHNREGYLRGARGVAPFDVPRGALGGNQPSTDIQTLSTPAILLAGTRLNSESVRRLTSVLLTKHADFERGMRFLSIRRIAPELGLPLHEGARAFYEGRPPLWVTYDPLVKLATSVLGFALSVASFVLSLRQARAKREQNASSSASVATMPVNSRASEPPSRRGEIDAAQKR